MSKKCRAYSESKLGLEPTDNRKAFYAGWDAALAQQDEPVQEPVYWEVRCTAHPKWMRVDEQQFHEYVSYGWEGQRLYTAPPQRPTEPVAVSVDALAQHIRFVDGNNNLGAGILAEKIVEFLIKLGIGKEQAEPVQEPDLSRCPQCNGPADNGHDRSLPPNPYLCTKCMAEMPQPSYNVTVVDDAHPNGIPLEQWQNKPVQEPVAYIHRQGDFWEFGCHRLTDGEKARGWTEETLYTAPPQRKPLAEWQINDLMADIDPEDVCSWSFRQGVYAAEKHHGVKP